MSKGGISGVALLARSEEGQAAAQREQEWEREAGHLAKRQIPLSRCPFTVIIPDHTEKIRRRSGGKTPQFSLFDNIRTRGPPACPAPDSETLPAPMRPSPVFYTKDRNWSAKKVAFRS